MDYGHTGACFKQADDETQELRAPTKQDGRAHSCEPEANALASDGTLARGHIPNGTEMLGNGTEPTITADAGVSDVMPDLVNLTAEILVMIEEDDLASDCEAEAPVARALKIGEKLALARGRLPRQFGSWVETTLKKSRAWAYNLITLWEGRDEIASARAWARGNNVHIGSYGYLRALDTLKAYRNRNRVKSNPPTKPEQEPARTAVDPLLEPSPSPQIEPASEPPSVEKLHASSQSELEVATASACNPLRQTQRRLKIALAENARLRGKCQNLLALAERSPGDVLRDCFLRSSVATNHGWKIEQVEIIAKAYKGSVEWPLVTIDAKKPPKAHQWWWDPDNPAVTLRKFRRYFGNGRRPPPDLLRAEDVNM
jgi:hypothetical protein